MTSFLSSSERTPRASYIALSLINSQINENLNSRIGPYQWLIKHKDYPFLKGKDRYVDCYNLKEVSLHRVVTLGEYIGVLSEADCRRVIELVNLSPVVSTAKLKQYALLQP